MQIVVAELARGGWECAQRSADAPTIDCPPGGAHKVAVHVTYANADSGCSEDDPCFLRFASYDAPRAFGTPCEKFADAMNDLTNAAHHFSVTCNDTTTDPATSQQFGFLTSITVTDPIRPGALDAAKMHEADRSTAIQKLASVKAIQAPKKRGAGEKHDVVR